MKTQIERWGWVPILTSELFIGSSPFSSIGDVTEISFPGWPKWVNLSDNFTEKLLSLWLRIHRKNIHQISITPQSFEQCSLCTEKVIILTLKINDYLGGLLLNAEAHVHSTGLVRYILLESNIVSQGNIHSLDHAHSLIRGLFHRHIHHSMDMVFPTVEANTQEAAIIKLWDQYQLKAIQYKEELSRRFPSGLRGLMQVSRLIFQTYNRAKGELCYMNAFSRLFNPSARAIVEDMEASFSVIGEKASFRQNREDHLDHLSVLILSIASPALVYLLATDISLGIKLSYALIVLILLPLTRAVSSSWRDLR